MSGGETTWSETSRSETSRSKKSWGETSIPKRPGAKLPGPKCQRAIRPGPKRLGAKTLPEPSLHDCETSSMIETLDEASLCQIVKFFLILLLFDLHV